MSSDHRPLSVCFDSLVATDVVITAAPQSQSCCTDVFYDWSKATSSDINSYQSYLSTNLAEVNVPACVLYCHTNCTSESHKAIICQYYSDIISCMKAAIASTVPVHRASTSKYHIPGWSDVVCDKHENARVAFLDWVAAGKPRSGVIHQLMCRTRASFKLALRYCRAHREQLQADACAKSYKDLDSRTFWKNVSRIANSKVTSYVNKIGDTVGDANICELWRDHYNALYNSVPDNGCRQSFHERVLDIDGFAINCIQVREVLNAVSGQKKYKSAGPNGLSMEAFVNGGIRLFTHLSLFFTFCLRHQFLPQTFMDITLIPLVKNKGGDMTDINNYRAIAVSNAETKILESIILSMVTSSACEDKYQFGFKAGHSTSLCTGVLKQTVSYYVSRGSHVLACFVDFSKAFDRVNYWKLFHQLLDDGIPASIVKFLAYWYSNQLAVVRWHNNVSAPFTIGNGTKQGGVLSPYLFTRYIRQLLYAISSCGVGCMICGMSVNILAYADDIVLLAPSWKALQIMLDLLCKCCKLLDITCNPAKTVCVNFPPTDRMKVVAHIFPSITLDGHPLKYVNEVRYLGHIITDKLKDDADIVRELRKSYTRINILARRFSRCSTLVKLRLFRGHFLCFYGVALWKNYTKGSLNKFRSCYHKCVKIFFGYPKFHSVTAILLELSLPSFCTLVHNSQYRFRQQWINCTNNVVKHMKSVGMTYM